VIRNSLEGEICCHHKKSSFHQHTSSEKKVRSIGKHEFLQHVQLFVGIKIFNFGGKNES